MKAKSKEKFIKLTFDRDLIRIQKENVGNIEYIGVLTQLLYSAQAQRYEWARKVREDEKKLETWTAVWGKDEIELKKFNLELTPDVKIKKKKINRTIKKKK